MNTTFASALNTMTPGDAVMCLAAGTVELALDDAPESTRWQWFADLLDSQWGLTGRLAPTLTVAVISELEQVARMCRVSTQHPLDPQAWISVYQSTTALVEDPAVISADALHLALSAANDIALEAIDTPHPDFSVAVTLAFEALTSAVAVDREVSRSWILTAIGKWVARAESDQLRPRSAQSRTNTDNRQIANAAVVSAGCNEKTPLKVRGNA
ncbi:hypothetical protein [Rhodococcus erythropolis]|uniref:hypothetical protein n=1 Tax=Rhodococcus erythropolis TaxID=1833 RepID=UPI001BE9ADD2|nr:hypothetical protein [Rhodococcus erythropolis]MBT2269079.1 hypothetical protein [Rhodococcus erythropolis]